ncbi:hypothetical protein Tco_0161913 [Tanacetum coccineum]
MCHTPLHNYNTRKLQLSSLKWLRNQIILQFSTRTNSKLNNANNSIGGITLTKPGRAISTKTDDGIFQPVHFSQNQLHRPQVNHLPAYQAPVPQTHSVTRTIMTTRKGNDAIMRNLQNNPKTRPMLPLLLRGQGHYPGNTVMDECLSISRSRASINLMHFQSGKAFTPDLTPTCMH